MSSRIHPLVISYPVSMTQDYGQIADYVCSQLPENRPYILIAESFAGPLALQISTRTGANLNALVLVASFLRNPRPGLARLAPLLLHEKLLACRPPKSLLRYLVAGHDADPVLLEELVAVLGTLPPRVLVQRLRAVMAVDVVAQWQACRVPALHLFAHHDHLIPAQASRAFRALRPDIRSIGISGPHFLLQTRPVECMTAIRIFLGEQGLLS